MSAPRRSTSRRSSRSGAQRYIGPNSGGRDQRDGITIRGPTPADVSARRASGRASGEAPNPPRRKLSTVTSPRYEGPGEIGVVVCRWVVDIDGAVPESGPCEVWAKDAERALRLAARRLLPSGRLDHDSVIVVGSYGRPPDSASAEVRLSSDRAAEVTVVWAGAFE